MQELIQRQAEVYGASPALEAPGRSPMTYAALHEQVASIGAELREVGVGRHDCVALVLPNGPEMLAAFLGVASSAVCAPINPAFQGPELEACLTGVNARAVIVPEGESPAREAAERRGLAVIDLLPRVAGEAGAFTLRTGGTRGSRGAVDVPGSDDIALLLYTSGTTSTQKLVPLTHGNILAGASSIRCALGLTPEDRLLSIMQLFHIAGLGLCLASLCAGGAIYVTTGFQISKFSEWFAEANPTWFWASPTILKELVERVPRYAGALSHSRLRFIRVGSSALSAELMAEAERVFKVPITTNYGMTEAAPQITSSPLPPRTRKPGSAGIAAGCEVAILGAPGEWLPPGDVGEVVIRGPNVIAGYVDNPEATREAFVDGWFRTGDLGFMDEEGYLFLTGRLKEIINRGGEKISPVEVDEVLAAHPAVDAAVTFSMPHPKLGEEVAAAIVLKPHSATEEAEIREFAAERLASFKVPRRIVLVEAIPKGATGKVNRLGLAKKLRLEGSSRVPNEPHPFVAPRDAVEFQVAKIWGEVLHVNPVSVTDDFYALGGYSLLAVELVEELQRVFGKKVTIASLLEGTTVEQHARTIRGDLGGQTSAALVGIKPTGKQPPIFCVHRSGGVALIFRPLAPYLDKEQPLYAFQARGLMGDRAPDARIEEMASFYLELIRGVQPKGPYCLGGASLGGVVAVEMAQQLHAMGESVASLCLFDTVFPYVEVPKKPFAERAGAGLRHSLGRAGFHARNVLALPPREKLRYLKERMKTGKRIVLRENNQYAALPEPMQEVIRVSRRALMRYRPRVYEGRITLFRALGSKRKYDFLDADPTLGWKGWATEGIDVIEVPGTHMSMLDEPQVQVLGEKLTAVLRRVAATERALSASRARLAESADRVASSERLPAAVGWDIAD